MGKKKSKNNVPKEEVGGLEISLSGDIKRSVAAIALFALAIFVLLGFVGKAGVVGEFLDKISSLFMGWTRFVLPIFLTTAGIILLLRKETSFYVSKLIGLSLALIS